MSSHKKMKAVVMKEFGKKEVFQMEDFSLPFPQKNQVCIRIKAAGFNPVDYKIRQGWYKIDPNQILGCDCSGIVDSLGDNVTKFSLGDEVYSMTGSFFQCSNGSYAEYVCVPEELVAKKPKNLSFEEAASVPLAAMTAYRATLAKSIFKSGDTVFVAGIGGGVGLFAGQFLQAAKVKDIYTVAKDKKSAEFITQILCINPNHIAIYKDLSMMQLKELLLEMTGGKLFDATLDLVGGTKIKTLCFELTGNSGHFSTVLPEDHFQFFDVWSENSIPRGRNLSIHQTSIGSELGSKDRNAWQIYTQHMSIITKMLINKTLKPYVNIVGELSVATVQKAHDLLESGRVKGKLVMTVPSKHE